MLDQPLSERLRAVRESHPAPDGEEGATPAPPERPRRAPLGELLVEKGALCESDLMLALAQQREDGRPLGQILLDMGVISRGELARTLTEQNGFDSDASLRRRLAAGDEAPVPEPEGEPDPEASSLQLAEQYVVRESPAGEPLHVADNFLDAADVAFELIEKRNPEKLEIVRSGVGEPETLWSYRRDDADDAGPAPDTAA